MERGRKEEGKGKEKVRKGEGKGILEKRLMYNSVLLNHWLKPQTSSTLILTSILCISCPLGKPLVQRRRDREQLGGGR